MFHENELNAAIARKGMTQGELAHICGMNPSTFYRKKTSGGNFTREEIETMVRVLEIDDPIAVFFAD